jgi:hypothetical protein
MVVSHVGLDGGILSDENVQQALNCALCEAIAPITQLKGNTLNVE